MCIQLPQLYLSALDVLLTGPLYIRETNRQAEIKELTSKGIIPNELEMEKHPEKSLQAISFLMGNVASLIHDVLPAQEIVNNMVNVAAEQISRGASSITVKAKL